MAHKMKAAFFRKTGNPEVIEWGEVEIPEVKEDGILVKTKAVALEHVDTYFRSGKYPLPKGSPHPFIVGHDLVGTIEKVGKNVHHFKPGQRVWSVSLGTNGLQGSFSEYVSAPATYFFPVPDNVEDLEMISVAQSGITACYGLIRTGILNAKEIIFVNGGGGGVGSAVIQLSKIRGARIIAATNGQEKMDWCKSCGAELVLDYKKNDIEKKVRSVFPSGVDLFWDTSRHPHFDLSVPLLAAKGRIVLMAGAGSQPPFPVGPFYQKECTMRGFSILNVDPEELRGYAEIVNRCVAEKHLKYKIAASLPLAETAKAHALIEDKADLWGKIILKP